MTEEEQLLEWQENRVCDAAVLAIADARPWWRRLIKPRLPYDYEMLRKVVRLNHEEAKAFFAAPQAEGERE